MYVLFMNILTNMSWLSLCSEESLAILEIPLSKEWWDKLKAGVRVEEIILFTIWGGIGR